MSSQGERIREAMEVRGLTRAQLAEQSGVSYTAISHYINNTRDMHLKTIRKLAPALGVKASWLAWGVR